MISLLYEERSECECETSLSSYALYLLINVQLAASLLVLSGQSQSSQGIGGYSSNGDVFFQPLELISFSLRNQS